MKQSGGKTGKLFETFYVGDGINQYFIPELKFKGTENESVICDFTYRDSSETVICNFSILSDKPYSKFSDVFFVYGELDFHLNDISKIFIEKRKSQFLSRYSSKMKIEEFLMMFDGKEFSFKVNTPDSKSSFEPTGKTTKSFEKLNSELISILKLGRD